MFSSLYLALVLVLVALIVAGHLVRVPRQGRRPAVAPDVEPGPDDRQRPGAAAARRRSGDLLAGLPIDENEEYTGTFWDLFTGFGVWTGLTLAAALPPARCHASWRCARRATSDSGRGDSVACLGLVGLLVVVVFAAWMVAIAEPGVGSLRRCSRWP